MIRANFATKVHWANTYPANTPVELVLSQSLITRKIWVMLHTRSVISLGLLRAYLESQLVFSAPLISSSSGLIIGDQTGSIGYNSAVGAAGSTDTVECYVNNAGTLSSGFASVPARLVNLQLSRLELVLDVDSAATSNNFWLAAYQEGLARPEEFLIA